MRTCACVWCVSPAAPPTAARWPSCALLPVPDTRLPGRGLRRREMPLRRSVSRREGHSVAVGQAGSSQARPLWGVGQGWAGEGRGPDTWSRAGRPGWRLRIRAGSGTASIRPSIRSGPPLSCTDLRTTGASAGRLCVASGYTRPAVPSQQQGPVSPPPPRSRNPWRCPDVQCAWKPPSPASAAPARELQQLSAAPEARASCVS